MSSEIPDIEDLLFYQQLTSNHADLYVQAQDSCSYMVIPLSVSYGSPLTRDIVASHLFRPSPLFKGKHVSLNDKCEMEFDIGRSIRVSYKTKGAGEKLFRIISQEDVRLTHRQRNYTLLIVEQPLIEMNGFRPTTVSNSITRLVNHSSVSFPAQLIDWNYGKVSVVF